MNIDENILNDEAIDIIYACTPSKKQTAPLKCVFLWKFVAAVGLYANNFQKNAFNYSDLFKAALKPFLKDILNGSLQMELFTSELL